MSEQLYSSLVDKINLGLCCINSTLNKNKPPITTNRSLNSRYTDELAQELATKNLQDLKTLIGWNYKNNIKCFRISSEMFPRFTDILANDRYINKDGENIKNTNNNNDDNSNNSKQSLSLLGKRKNTMDNMEPNYSIDTFDTILQEAGELAIKYNQRLVMHACPFSKVGAPTEGGFINTCRYLQHYTSILDRMQIPTIYDLVNESNKTNNNNNNNSNNNQNFKYIGAGVITIHGGGLYMTKKPLKPTGKNVTKEKLQEYNLKLYNARIEAKKVTKQRWIEQFYKLPINVQRRLAIENDEDDFNITDCLEIAQACNIPVVVDFFHYQCFQERHYANELDPPIVGLISNKNNDNNYISITPEFQQLFTSVLATWHGTRPLFHISERITGVQPTDKNSCAHSDYITKIPNFILELFKLYCPLGVDLEVEAKAKELSIFHLWHVQPFLYSHMNNSQLI